MPAVRAFRPAPWSFAFIDGYHEGDAPRDDARAVLPLLADDALVMFHDLISPHVAAGLAVFADAGWSVGLYNTMQIMGAAWRGKARPAAACRGQGHAGGVGGASADVSAALDLRATQPAQRTRRQTLRP